MPRVPLLQPQQRLSPLPGPTIGSNVTPDLLGGTDAKALAKTGSELMQGGVILNRMQVDEQERVNHVRVNDAMNKAIEAELELTHDKDAGYANLRGEKALNRPDGLPLEEEYVGKLKGRLSGISSQLGNDYQKQLFQMQTDQMVTKFRGSLKQHTSRAFNEYNLSVQNGTIGLGQQKMGTEWGTPDSVLQGRNAIVTASAESGKLRNLSGSEIKLETLNNLSVGHSSVISAAVDAGQLDYAREYLKQSKDELTPDAQRHAVKLLDAGDFEVRTQTLSEKFMSEAKGNHQLAIKLAREKTSGKEEDGTVSRIKQMYQEKEAFREQGQRHALEAGWKFVNEGGDINKMPPSIKAAMDPQAFASMRRTVEADATGGVKTDSDVYYALTQASVADPAAFQREDLRPYSDKLSIADRKHFIDLQAKLAKGEAEEVSSIQGQIDARARAMGLNKQDAGLFNIVADKELFAEQKIKGRKLDMTERDKVLDRLTLEGKDGWFGKTHQYKAIAEGEPFRPKWSDADRRKAKAALERQGNANPSTDQIDALLRLRYGVQ